MRRVLKSGIGGASGFGNRESGIRFVSRLSFSTMSAILVQLIGRHNLAPRIRSCFRISARISNYNFATPSCSRTFVQSTHCRRTITGPFTALRHRPIFTSAPLSLRYHLPRNPRRARGFLEFLDNIPQDFIFYGIIGINSAVFVMWYMAVQKYVSEDLPRYMNCLDLANSRNNRAILRLSYG